MDDTALREAARKELIRRAAKRELERRRAMRTATEYTQEPMAATTNAPSQRPRVPEQPEASPLQRIRVQYPQYNDMTDADLAKAIHGKFYADMPFDEFSKRAGLPPEGMPWSQVPGEALRNTPASAGQFLGNLTQAITSPIETITAVGDLGAGALRAGAQAVLPTAAFDYLDSFNNDAAQKAGRTASAVGGFFADRYGSEEGFKRAIATDPVGVLADASTVFMGGAGAARAALGAGSRTARALDTAARVTNPLTPVIKAGEIGARATGATTKALLGATTGTSAETIGEAFRAGLMGGREQRAFLGNMRGLEDQAAAVEEARSAVGRIADVRSKQYANDMRAIKADTRPIDFKPIEQKFLDVVDSMYSGKHQIAADETIAKLDRIQNVLAEWSADPSMHTAGGLDALKRRIDNLMPSFADANAGNTERAVTAIRNAVKDEIIKAAPQYASAMKNFETSKAAQREIERSLSLGKGNATDTAIRKLQSLTRNNASTNYGSRLNSAEILREAGAETLMPRLAGQALNSRMPRGLMQAVAGASILGGSLLNPAFLAALPLTSPRLAGEAARAAGAATRYARKVPLPSREQLLGWQQQGRVALLGQE
jgi:hypothetical protein